MGLGIKLRKMHAIIALALLFCFIAGIIIIGTDEVETRPVLSEQATSTCLIIDPGHGGADGGAVASDGTRESVINLAIALRLDSLARFCGVQSLLTRSSEDLPYPESEDSIAKMKRWDQHRRLELINSTDKAILISIHQNKYPDPRPFGPQVLYGSVSGSNELGLKCHELLNLYLCPENRRVASPASDNIYLMKNAACPAILVECGFISNSQELSQLQQDNYQKKLAAIILAAYLCYKS